MTSPFCWQPWPNPVSLGPRPKDLHTQVPKSRPLSEKGAELIRKRRIKKVFGSFNKGPFKGKRLCFGLSQDMTHSSPGMCIDRSTNPHSFASPSFFCWTSPSAPQDQTSISRLRRARSLFQINEGLSTCRSMRCKLQTFQMEQTQNCSFSNACRTRARAR